MAKKRRPSKRTEPKQSEAAAIDEFFALESAPPASVMDELEIRGCTFPHPDELTDEALPAVLWRMIRSLACMRTFVFHTDHFTDRQLYVYLWRDGLRESFVATPQGLNGGFFLDLIGSGSDEHHALYLRHYADTATRRRYAKRGEKLPRKQRPPFDRDRFMPKCGRPFDLGPAFNPKKWRAPKPADYLR